jgi:hypothetical protein
MLDVAAPASANPSKFQARSRPRRSPTRNHQPPPTRQPRPPPPPSSGKSPSSSRPSAKSVRRRRMAPSMPRSNSYERLEGGGMGPSPPAAMGQGGWMMMMSGQKKFAWWKKFAVGALMLFGIVWFFGPRAPRHFSWGSKKPGEFFFFFCRRLVGPTETVDFDLIVG